MRLPAEGLNTGGALEAYHIDDSLLFDLELSQGQYPYWVLPELEYGFTANGSSLMLELSNPSLELHQEGRIEGLYQQISNLEGNYEDYNALVMHLRNPDDGMEGGQVPVPAVAPQLQATISNYLTTLESVEAVGVRGKCERLSQSTLDECFLPTVALVFFDQDGGLETKCTGTIIGPREVLTAAHCVCEDPQFILVGTSSFGRGIFYRSRNDDNNVMLPTPVGASLASALVSVVNVSMYDRPLMDDVFCNNSGDANTTLFEQSDIAIVYTGNVLPFRTTMRAQLIPAPITDSNINIAGFGPDPTSQDKSKLKSLKRYLSIKLTSQQGAIHIASGPTGDSCEGDSGSGAYQRQSSGRLGIFAVLSNGRGICAPNSPARYVALDGPRLDWLRTTVSELDELIFSTPSVDMGFCLGRRCGEPLPKI